MYQSWIANLPFVASCNVQILKIFALTCRIMLLVSQVRYPNGYLTSPTEVQRTGGDVSKPPLVHGEGLSGSQRTYSEATSSGVGL